MRKEIFVGELPVVETHFYDHKGTPRNATGVKAFVGTREWTVPPIAEPAGDYELILPYEDYSEFEREFDLRWQFDFEGNSYSRTERIAVVSPVAHWSDFEGQMTYADFRRAEQLVREIITAHCNQSFGKYIGTLPVEGGGSDSLILPRHIIAATQVIPKIYANNVIDPNDPAQWVPDWQFGIDNPSTTPTVSWEVAGEGWVLRRPGRYKAIDPVHVSRNVFGRNTIFDVTGIWGYDSVPAPVLKAANILMEDYVCPDINYRNKYLESIKFDQHRLGYDQRAWNGTGNVMADQLLREFRVSPVAGVI